MVVKVIDKFDEKTDPTIARWDKRIAERAAQAEADRIVAEA